VETERQATITEESFHDKNKKSKPSPLSRAGDWDRENEETL